MKLTYNDLVLKISGGKESTSFTIEIGTDGSFEITAQTIEVDCNVSVQEDGDELNSGLIMTGDPVRPVINPTKVSSLDVAVKPIEEGLGIINRAPQMNELQKDVPPLFKTSGEKEIHVEAIKQAIDTKSHTTTVDLPSVVLSDEDEKLVCCAFVHLNGRDWDTAFKEEFDPLERYVYNNILPNIRLEIFYDRFNVRRTIEKLFPSWSANQVDFAVAQELTTRFLDSASEVQLLVLNQLVKEQENKRKSALDAEPVKYSAIYPLDRYLEDDSGLYELVDASFVGPIKMLIASVVQQENSYSQKASKSTIDKLNEMFDEGLKKKSESLMAGEDCAVSKESALDDVKWPNGTILESVDTQKQQYDREKARQKWLEDGKAARKVLYGN